MPYLLEGTETIANSSIRLRISGMARTWTSYCSPAFVVIGHFQPGHQQAERAGHVGDADAQFAHFRPVELHAELRRSFGERGIDIDHAGHLSAASS